MKTNVDDLVDGATAAPPKPALADWAGQRPDLAPLVSCVWRKLVMMQRVEEEVEAIRDIFGGFSSYGELSPFRQRGECRLHNQTMTITALAQA